MKFLDRFERWKRVWEPWDILCTAVLIVFAALTDTAKWLAIMVSILAGMGLAFWVSGLPERMQKEIDRESSK